MFVEALRRHLELARQGLLTTRRFPTWMDDARREAKVLEIFDAAEKQAGEKGPWPGEDRWQGFWSLLQRWGDGHAQTLVEHAVAHLAESGLLSGQPDEDEWLIAWVLRKEIVARGVHRSDELRSFPSQVRGLRLQASARRAAAEAVAVVTALGDFPTRRYAEELQLTKTTDSTTTLRPAGAVFLGLRGRDAMRWLLALEVSAALGDQDPWRISSERAQPSSVLGERMYGVGKRGSGRGISTSDASPRAD
ncbi:hypothetical protein [Nannocystis pusilla]|uniref:Uncharacterized protein n=1 Tax=Nannocystis pusilla TaxID=889268 RepID=A0ABS7TT51_9BACT|nr:hypothetical protein [Nannocystis pusilla]MBZ5711410.1 hypothetical protein [Nannocystis pusilla]